MTLSIAQTMASLVKFVNSTDRMNEKNTGLESLKVSF